MGRRRPPHAFVVNLRCVTPVYWGGKRYGTP